MDHAPLTLRVLEISPPTLIASPSSDQTQAQGQNTSYDALPEAPEPLPLPPTNFSFSPTANYPAPYGSVSLGSTLSLHLELINTHPAQHVILGVRMMVEVQGPSGRYRLGEVVHSNTGSVIEDDTSVQKTDDTPAPALAELRHGESVKIKVENETKDLGLNIVIVSAAWETLDGRRTLQRFLKFNVNPPLAIKTRIQIPSHPNTSLDAIKRQDVYLEILMQNTSGQGMVLSRVVLEPVQGLKSRSVDSFLPTTTTSPRIEDDTVDGDGEVQKSNKEALLPNDTRQYLFILSPSSDIAAADDIPLSTFPPTYAGGTILPLGRLDVSWYSGSYHIPGRLQTSTLNRRVPLAPLHPSSGSGSMKPVRTSSNQGVASAGHNLITPIPRTSASTLIDGEETKVRPKWEWEYDLTVQGDRTVGVEDTLVLNLKLAVRSVSIVNAKTSTPARAGGGEINLNSNYDPLEAESDGNKIPTPPRIGVQYLTTSHTSAGIIPLPTPSTTPAPAGAGTGTGMKPSLALSPPSRSNTPLSTTSTQNRPYSPLTSVPSRTGTPTPLSAQLRQAVGSHLSLSSASASASGFNLTSSSKVQLDTAGGAQAVTTTANGTPGGNGSASGTTMTVSFPPQPIMILDNSNSNSNLNLSETTNKPLPPLHHPATKRPNNPMINTGQLTHIGNSLFLPTSQPVRKVKENKGPTYNNQNEKEDERGVRHEVVYEFPMKFFALQYGLTTLGGLRILLFDDDRHENNDDNVRIAQNGESGTVVREWESLGDVWITD